MASERKRAEKEVKKIVFVSNEAARTGPRPTDPISDYEI
jgi:hypothetical protein